jgi:hypothetical protein
MPALPDQRPVSSRRRRLWITLLLLTGALFLLLVVPPISGVFLVKSRQAEQRLQEAIAQLDQSDPGWRLASMEAERTVIPNQINSALRIATAHQLLPYPWPGADFNDSLPDLDLTQPLTNKELSLFLEEMHRTQPARTALAGMEDLPVGRFPITFSRNAFSTQLPHLEQIRAINALLCYDTRLRAEQKDLRGAMTCCRAAFNTARAVGDESFGISQLVRTACVLNALNTTEQVLARGQADDADLQALQNSLEKERTHPSMLIAARGDRAALHELFDAIEAGESTFEELNDSGKRPDLYSRMISPYTRLVVKLNHPQILELMTRFVEIARLPFEKRLPEARQWQADLLAVNKENNPLILVVPAEPKLAEADQRKQALLRCMIVLLAVERFRLMHGNFPDTLASLGPELPPDVLLDPYDAKPLRYVRTGGDVIVYSIGPDGQDDGGTLDRKNPIRPGTDTGFQLWNVDQRRQAAR